MASDATINLVLELVKVGLPLAAAAFKNHTGKEISEVPVSEAMQGLRELQIRSVEELIAEGKWLAEKDKKEEGEEEPGGA